MKRLASALCLAVLATGCLQAPPIGEALPLSQDVQVKLPENSGNQQYALGQIADTYILTRNFTRGFNAGAAFVLVLVHAIVQQPPTSVDGDTYTWGPGSKALDPADYRLVVTDNLDGTYNWSLDGKSKLDPNAEFLVLVDGTAVEGADPHRGSGEFTLHFDNSAIVNPIDNEDNRGTVTVYYDLENRDGTAATVDMDIDSTDDAGQPFIAGYHYAELEDGSGDFQFDATADFDENGAQEDAIIRSRWTAEGAGRGDVLLSGGDLETAITVTASECWDTSFQRIYYADSHDFQPAEGDVNDCAFADQDLPGA